MSAVAVDEPTQHLLVVRAGGGLWALPMDAVEHTVDLRALRSRSVGSSRMVLLRGKALEVRDLASDLGLGGSQAPNAGVVVWAAGRRRVFGVDEAVGQFVLERSAMPGLARGRYCAGVALLDDEVVPVLEPGAVVGAWGLGDQAALGFSELERSALIEVANIGSGHAATALSELLGRSVTIRYTEALITTVGEAADRVGAPASQSAVVDTPVADEGGKVLLLFPDDGAEQLCALLGTSLDDPVGRSALAEVGNILTSSYLNAIVQMTGLELAPEPPRVEIGVLGSLVERSLADADPSDPTILMRSCLAIEAADAKFVFLFVPQLRSVHELLGSLGLGGSAPA